MSEKDKELYKIIGNILKRARTEKELTNVSVANILCKRGFEISDTSLRRYESGVRGIPVDLLIELCDIYDIDYNEVTTQAQIRRLQVIDPSYKIFSKDDPDPISTLYGADVSELTRLYLSLNNQGRSQALTMIKSLTYNPDLMQKEKENLA